MPTVSAILNLLCHPATPCPLALQVSVTLYGQASGLVLRYQVITRYCNELGAPLALQLVCYAEERLQAKGWAPGADGLDVQALKRLDGAH